MLAAKVEIRNHNLAKTKRCCGNELEGKIKQLPGSTIEMDLMSFPDI